MKVRWREHEMLFVTILAAAQIIIFLLEMHHPSHEQSGFNIEARLRENGISFIYWRNVLLPQVSSILLMYVGYLSINLIILPLVKKSPLMISKSYAR